MTTLITTLPVVAHAARSHAKYAPSATKRWLACPGSVPMSEGLESESSSYANEGEAAHEVGEQALRTGQIVTEDDEVRRCIAIYLNAINEIRARNPFMEHIETKFHHKTLANFSGTCDYCAAYSEGSDTVLHFVDYKHGAGVPVSAVENEQVLSYALIIDSNFFEGTFTKFRGTIVQPRIFNQDPVTHWEFDRARLAQHYNAVTIAMQSNIVQPGAHCRWCPAAVHCQPLRDAAVMMAQAEFPDVIPDAEVSQWVAVFAMKDAVNELFKKVENKLIGVVMRGAKLPGYKVVESFSHRKWVGDEAATVKGLTKLKIGKKVAFEQKLRTPSQVQDAAGLKAEDIAHLVHRESQGYHIVSNDVRGKEAVFNAKADFAGVVTSDVVAGNDVKNLPSPTGAVSV